MNARILLLALAWGFFSMAPAEDTQAAAKPDAAAGWSTKTFDIKYVDPEKLREIFSGRSFVIDANRDLKVLTASGSLAFLKEVEDTVKRFDVPPPVPQNIQISFYLLTTAVQAPVAGPLPPELADVGKELGGKGSAVLRLADSQTIRVREGQPGEAADSNDTPDSSKLARVRIQSVSVMPNGKTSTISINGLSVWLKIPPVSPDANRPAGKTDPDVSADIDLEPNQAVLVSKVGVDKPVAVVVRATVVH